MDPGKLPYDAPPYQPTQMITPTQLTYQHIHQQQQQQHLRLQQQLQMFWTNQYREIENTTDFRNHSLPLARIKKIMKSDEDVRMISAEAPLVFAKACEMFILELTYRAWSHTEENKRRTLQKNDVAAAINRTNIFDFLVDIVPWEDSKDEPLPSLPMVSNMQLGGSAESHSYYFPVPQVVAPGMMVGKPVMDQSFYAQHPAAYMDQHVWNPPNQHQILEQPPVESGSE